MDHYKWFDPFAANEEVEYAYDALEHERREWDRELNMLRGALRATEAHNKHILEALSNEASLHLSTRQFPVFVPASSVGA